MLDEPANGLDPQGIRWLRDFLRAKAAEGRTVLVSSHVLSEVAQTVDDVVVISRGRLSTRARSATSPPRRRRLTRVRGRRRAAAPGARGRAGARSPRATTGCCWCGEARRAAGRRDRAARGRRRCASYRAGRLAGGRLPRAHRRPAEGPRRDPLIRGELIKLRTTRTALGFARAAVALVLRAVLIELLAGTRTRAGQARRGEFGGDDLVRAADLRRGRRDRRVPPPHARPSLLIAPDRGQLRSRGCRLRRRRPAHRPADAVVASASGCRCSRAQTGPDLGAATPARGGGGVLAAVLWRSSGWASASSCATRSRRWSGRSSGSSSSSR